MSTDSAPTLYAKSTDELRAVINSEGQYRVQRKWLVQDGESYQSFQPRWGGHIKIPDENMDPATDTRAALNRIPRWLEKPLKEEWRNLEEFNPDGTPYQGKAVAQ